MREADLQRKADTLLSALRWGGEPKSAALLAKWVHRQGGTETQRRRVREVIDYARNQGHRICGNGDGYWLARSAGEWARYLESRKSGARFEFVRTRQMQEAARDARGQQALFVGATGTTNERAWAER